MKKISILTLVLLLTTSATLYSDTKKMDSLLQVSKNNPHAGKAVLGKAISLNINIPTIDCLIKSSNTEKTKEYIEYSGGLIQTILGDIMSVTIPLGEVDKISELEEVISMEAAKPMISKMNAARGFTNVDDVQAGTGLSQAYTGSGVLVGVTDNTIDYGHADFLGSDGTTRICYIRNPSASGGATTCRKAGIDDGSCTITDGGTGYHGTHVTGIAAGSSGTYTGVAPEAFIAFGFTGNVDGDPSGSTTNYTAFSTSVLNNVSALFTEADNMDVPAVINLSLGTSLGAHDDTSLLEQGLNSAVSGKQGRVIVNAAGNENLNTNDPNYSSLGGIHAGATVSSGSDIGWRVNIRSSSMGSYVSSAIATVWLDDTTYCENTQIQVYGYTRGSTISNTGSAGISTTAIDFSDDNTSTDNTNGANTVGADVYTFQSDSQNSRPNALVYMGPTTSGSWSNVVDSSSGYYFDIVIRVPSGSCAVNMWLYPDLLALISFMKDVTPITISGSTYQLEDGDSSKTITIPGTASGVITVGSYMGRGTWIDAAGNTQDQTDYSQTATTNATGGTVGDISLFSSLGPTGEVSGARTKPDIAAPGEPIISTAASAETYSSIIMGDSTHLKLEGTSMASPHVAGIVALMLERNNCLTSSQVKSYLTDSATAVGTQPNNTYGYGKADALAAIQLFSADTSCYNGTACAESGSDDDDDDGGGSSSGGGCGNISSQNGSLDLTILLLLLAPLAIITNRLNRSSSSNRSNI